MSNQALVYKELGRHAGAVGLLERGLQLAPGNLTLLYNLGIVLKAQGDTTRAREVFQRGIDLELRDSRRSVKAEEQLRRVTRGGKEII